MYRTRIRIARLRRLTPSVWASALVIRSEADEDADTDADFRRTVALGGRPQVLVRSRPIVLGWIGPLLSDVEQWGPAAGGCWGEPVRPSVGEAHERNPSGSGGGRLPEALPCFCLPRCEDDCADSDQDC